MKNILKGTIILIAIIVIVLLGKYAWAKYMTEAKGEAYADIAHFSFTVSEQSSNSLTIDLADTRLPNDTISVAQTAIAPGTKGALAFDINANVSDVSLEYDIDIDITKVPQNLIFYYDEEMKNAIYHSGNTIKIKGFFNSDIENKKTTNLIYWHWPLETGQTQEEIDSNDENDSTYMGDLITIDIQVLGQQVKTNSMENQYGVSLNANGGVINGYGNAEIITKIVTNGKYGELPETRKNGYSFEGWYTNQTGGERISEDTLVGENVTCYAQWTPNSYTLTINPNGGIYNFQTESVQITQKCGTSLGLKEPTREGYIFDGWVLSGGGSMQRGMLAGDETVYLENVSKTIKTDEYGNKYSNYTVNYQNIEESERWARIDFLPYSYAENHEYRISICIKTQQSGFAYALLRHAAVSNDFDTVGAISKGLKSSNDFIEYTLTRKFTGTKIKHYRIDWDIEPRVEICWGISSGSTGILDMDVKNISIYDITAGRYITDGVYGGYIYKYGSGNATVSARWIKDN